MSKEQKHIDEVILLRVLENRANEAEQALFKNWISHSEENRKYYQELKKVDMRISRDKEDHETTWNGIVQKAKKAASVPEYIELPSIKKANTKVLYFNALKIAAVLIIAVGVSFLFTQFFSTPKQLSILAENNGREVPYILPDNSLIYMNEGARITFPENFGEKIRTLSLEGEAFFEVKRNEEIPFLINTQQTTIKVLGTSFNVKSDPQKQVNVSVVTGLVEFSVDETPSKLQLKAGEQGNYKPENGEIQKLIPKNQNFLTWKTGVFYFDETPVTEAFTMLETYYDHYFIYKEENHIPSITTTIERQSLEAVLEELNLLLKTTYTTRNDTIIFTPRY